VADRHWMRCDMRAGGQFANSISRKYKGRFNLSSGSIKAIYFKFGVRDHLGQWFPKVVVCSFSMYLTQINRGPYCGIGDSGFIQVPTVRHAFQCFSNLAPPLGITGEGKGSVCPSGYDAGLTNQTSRVVRWFYSLRH